MENDNQPLVSVVIACYNHEHFVQDCIQSIIDQTYENIELIIIDDGSKDRSVEKIQEMIFACEKRFKRFEFRYRPNKGLSRTLNEALVWCEGEYYSPFASDDMMCSDKIKSQIEIFLKDENINIEGVFGGYELIDNTNKIIDVKLKKGRSYTFNDLLIHNFDLPAPTALLRLESVIRLGGYNEELKIEDWYMWLKLTESGAELLYVSQILVKYRSHGNNISKNLVLMNKERQKVLDCFASHSGYLVAKSKMEWLCATDILYLDHIKAMRLAYKKIIKNPLEVFSKNFLRFIYHALKVKK